MELVCDDKTIQKEVSKLHDICVSEGAILHEALRMVVDGDSMWLESKLQPENRAVLISLPDSCLPRLEPVTFKVSGNDIEIDAIEEGKLTQTQERCLRHMINIYNATHKLAGHKKTSPWFALADAPELLETLVAGRKGAPRVMELFDRTMAGVDDDFLVDSFLGTRKYGALGPSVLMPFIDYANHHSQSPGFQNGAPSAPTEHKVSLVNSKPLNGADEVRVMYSQLDALDTFITYGFVDDSSIVVRSTPADIETDILNIRVESRIGIRNKKQVHKNLRDIQGFLPQIIARDEGSMTISHLIVPSRGAPQALRRVLNWLFRTQNNDLGLTRLRSLVKLAEDQLIEANLAYLNDLAAQVEAAQEKISPETKAALNSLIEKRRGMVENYQNMFEVQ
jgi:hypothetical protein